MSVRKSGARKSRYVGFCESSPVALKVRREATEVIGLIFSRIVTPCDSKDSPCVAV